MLAALSRSNPVTNAIANQPAVNASEQAKPVPLDTETLHAKPDQIADDYGFSKLKSDTAPDDKLKALLNRFEINDKATKYDNAVLSQDGKTLLIVNRGPVALREVFGGSNAVTRTLYKLFGWALRRCGKANKSIAAAKYREMVNSADIDMQHEPLKHLFGALKSGEYHTVSVFYQDPKTGDFDKNPNAVAVIDAYENLIAPNLRRQMKGQKESEIEAEITKREAEFQDCYAADKFIPIKEGLRMGQLFHQVAEGLQQAQGFKMLVLPSQVHSAANTNSSDLNYQEIDFHSAGQDADGNWFLSGDPKFLDQIDSISAEDKQAYRRKLKQSSFSPKLTVARPLADANKPIDPYLAYVQQWSLMSKGSGLRSSKKQDLELIELSEPVNAAIIEAYNQSIAN